jgi:hypothetical protein
VTIRPRSGDLEAAARPHAPRHSGEYVGAHVELCDLCGFSFRNERIHPRGVAGTDITGEQAVHVLAHYGAGGFPAGDFTMALIGIIVRADPTNMAKLSLGFPGYVAAVRLAQDDRDGVTRLQEIARETGLL